MTSDSYDDGVDPCQGTGLEVDPVVELVIDVDPRKGP